MAFLHRPLIGQSSRHAISSHHSEYEFIPAPYVSQDLAVCLSHMLLHIENTLCHEFGKLERGNAFKFQVKVKVEMEKFCVQRGEIISVNQWFVSNSQLVLTPDRIKSKLQAAVVEAVGHFDNFVAKGSGWTLRFVEKVLVSLSKFRVFFGGCRKEHLPEELRGLKSLISVSDGEREKCFLFAVIAGVCPQARNPSRLTSLHARFLELMPKSGFKFPVGPREIDIFERSTDVSVNVYGYERQRLVPYRVTEVKRSKTKHVNLLLHKYHYYTITNLPALVRKIARVHRRRSFVCEHCLSYFASATGFHRHQSLCAGGTGLPIEMPEEGSVTSFNRYSSLLNAPFVIYADLESCIRAEEDQSGNGKLISTRDHDCIAWACQTVCRDRAEFSSPKPITYTGAHAIARFFEYIECEFSRIQDILANVIEPMQMTDEDILHFAAQTHCEMCGSEFVPRHYYLRKVRDHCHLSGRYRFALCNRCNFTHGKQQRKVFVFFHGLSNYDSHFVIQELHRFKSDRLKVIPRTGEKYLSFSVGDLAFKDSCQFLSDSLSNLVKNLRNKGEHHFVQVRRCFRDARQRELLYRKGVFPYNHVVDLAVLAEKQLPPKEAFFNDLSRQDISDDEYTFAQEVWRVFDCKNLGDYMTIYLIADVLLLADCFESFRDNCIGSYELDPVHYFSNANYTWDAFLRMSKVHIELFTDLNQLLFIQQAIRGGVSMVSGTRMSSANNPYLPDYQPESEHVYIIDLDCNNLYGKCMTEYLPVGDFSWLKVKPDLVQRILRTKADSHEGFIVECDLLYPHSLHDHHSDYPLAPVKKAVPFEGLSPFARMICTKHNLKTSTNTEKLMTTLEDKLNYVLHYRNLQLYLSLGMKLVKVHRVLVFSQAPIMREYIEFNSRKRAAARNDFDVKYYKDMSNSLYGKTMERMDKRIQVHLVNSVPSFQSKACKVTYKGAKIINPDLVSVEMKQSHVKMTKPIFLGFVILELAKNIMFDFHYNVMLRKYGPEKLHLLYTDTDSLIYEVKTEDLYQDLKEFPKGQFDFSNYPKEHTLFSTAFKRRPGSFKDECAGKPIKSFVGLRSKMYSLQVHHGNDLPLQDVKVAKGVKRSVIEGDLKHENYVECLLLTKQMEHDFHTIRSQCHSVRTNHQYKTSLSSLDDKRFAVDHVTSLPYGHYKIKQQGLDGLKYRRPLPSRSLTPASASGTSSTST